MLNWSLNSCGFRKPLCVKKQPLKSWYVLVQFEGCARDTQILPPYKTPWSCRSVFGYNQDSWSFTTSHPSIRNPKHTKKKIHTPKEGKIDAFFGKPTKLDFFKVPGLRRLRLHFFVEVSGLKPTPGFSLPIKLRFLQELEDEQQKEHALTEVRGSVFLKKPWRQPLARNRKLLFFFPPPNEKKTGYGPGCENSSRKVIF